MTQHPADVMREVAARVAFIEMAALAICERAPNEAAPNALVWEGLYHFSLDLRHMLTDAAKAADAAA